MSDVSIDGKQFEYRHTPAFVRSLKHGSISVLHLKSTGDWSELSDIAPRTKAAVEACAIAPRKPVLGVIPSSLLIPSPTPSLEWSAILESDAGGGVTVREVLLRWLITRAIVDQGSDIEGVNLWHHGVVDGCYSIGLQFLHDPAQLFGRYQEFIAIATAERDRVVNVRKTIWAAGGSNRTANAYNVFTVDGQRAFHKHTHAFVAGRMLPGLLSSLVVKGGLTELVFGRATVESPREMARRIRTDSTVGLGACIGDKACDLFAKWAVGTFDLGAGLGIPWSRADCPLPMDQRVGRVLMRCGFMDEFFGVVAVASVKRQGFTPPGKLGRPSIGDPLPKGTWHLMVKDFRRYSSVKDDKAVSWLISVGDSAGFASPAKWRPQDVLSALCRSFNSNNSADVSPVELDDYLMDLATICTDESPQCFSCGIAMCCQANNDLAMTELKKYKT